jgi:hypothetical protein
MREVQIVVLLLFLPPFFQSLFPAIVIVLRKFGFASPTYPENPLNE